MKYSDSIELGIIGAAFGAGFSIAFHPEHILEFTVGTGILGFILPLIGSETPDTKEKSDEVEQ